MIFSTWINHAVVLGPAVRKAQARRDAERQRLAAIPQPILAAAAPEPAAAAAAAGAGGGAGAKAGGGGKGSKKK